MRLLRARCRRGQRVSAANLPQGRARRIGALVPGRRDLRQRGAARRRRPAGTAAPPAGRSRRPSGSGGAPAPRAMLPRARARSRPVRGSTPRTPRSRAASRAGRASLAGHARDCGPCGCRRRWRAGSHRLRHSATAAPRAPSRPAPAWPAPQRAEARAARAPARRRARPSPAAPGSATAWHPHSPCSYTTSRRRPRCAAHRGSPTLGASRASHGAAGPGGAR